MQYWVINIICGFLTSALLAGIIIPQILLIAFRKKLFDEPGERKIHQIPVPRLGGLAFTPVIFFTLAILFGINQYLNFPELAADYSSNINVLAMSLCSMTLLYLVGIADDLIGVRYRAKFIIQIIIRSDIILFIFLILICFNVSTITLTIIIRLVPPKETLA